MLRVNGIYCAEKLSGEVVYKGNYKYIMVVVQITIQILLHVVSPIESVSPKMDKTNFRP